MDNLRTPAQQLYNGIELYVAALKNQPTLDAAGKILVAEVCKRKHIQQAKKQNYTRRVYSPSYLTRDADKRVLYMDNFEDLGPRWVKDASDVRSGQKHNGWYTDDCDGVLIGVVLCFTRGGLSDEDGCYGGNVPTKPKGRVVYMAGTRHSDWDGVTLDMDTTDDPITAACWADGMAEREAEICREEFERDQIEQRTLELQEQIAESRTNCLKLLRDMRPIRKGLMSLPESVYQALKTQVESYCEDIAGYRNELKDLT